MSYVPTSGCVIVKIVVFYDNRHTSMHACMHARPLASYSPLESSSHQNFGTLLQLLQLY
eukprot:COSAG01_NODE_404_length_17467_cov_69.758650_12_plen_59_part_00